MRDSVLWRKQSHVIMMLAEELNVDIEQAMDLYYSTKTSQLLSDAESGLQLMSDKYIVEDIIAELSKENSSVKQ